MGTPKARLVVEGATLLERHAHRLRELGCARDATVAVVRPPVQMTPPPVDALLVPVLTESPAASLAFGLRELRERARTAPREDDAILVTPVDMLPPSIHTLTKLVDAIRCGEGRVDAATPICRGRSGHPAVVRYAIVARYIDELAEVERTGQDVLPPLRDVLRGARRVRVDVDDVRVLDDLDTPSDLLALRRGDR